MPMYQRPAFWRVPHQRPDPDDERNFARRRVTPGTPAGRDLSRGDIIAKIDDYDARDLRHEDAQNLFKNASNQIKLVVQRGRPSNHLYPMPHNSGSYIGRSPTPSFYYERYEDSEREGMRESAQPQRSPIVNAAAPPFRTPSPLPTSAWRGPESLPRSTPVPPYTQFPVQQEGEFRTVIVSPTSHNDEVIDESIQSQPYRTTPLVLPGAKVRREPGPTESYLRHHPNPAMRAPPHHDYRDTLMKQKFVHKQFNSPINLYSEQNIANSIRQQTTPLPSNGHYGRPHVVKSHKPTVLYDPAKSDTYRALQEQNDGVAQEVPTPPQTKVFTAPQNKEDGSLSTRSTTCSSRTISRKNKKNEQAAHRTRPTPVPKPAKQTEAHTNGKQTTFVNSLHEEHIQQSNSFKRLMYNVLGDTEF